MSSINLEEILKSKLENYSDGNGFYGFASFVNQDQINLVLEAMKEACNQTVDEAVKRCAENADVTDGNNVLEHFWSDYGTKIYANTKSILQVADQLKKELE